MFKGRNLYSFNKSYQAWSWCSNKQRKGKLFVDSFILPLFPGPKKWQDVSKVRASRQFMQPRNPGVKRKVRIVKCLVKDKVESFNVLLEDKDWCHFKKHWCQGWRWVVLCHNLGHKMSCCYGLGQRMEHLRRQHSKQHQCCGALLRGTNARIRGAKVCIDHVIW